MQLLDQLPPAWPLPTAPEEEASRRDHERVMQEIKTNNVRSGRQYIAIATVSAILGTALFAIAVNISALAIAFFLIANGGIAGLGITQIIHNSNHKITDILSSVGIGILTAGAITGIALTVFCLLPI